MASFLTGGLLGTAGGSWCRTTLTNAGGVATGSDVKTVHSSSSMRADLRGAMLTSPHTSKKRSQLFSRLCSIVIVVLVVPKLFSETSSYQRKTTCNSVHGFRDNVQMKIFDVDGVGLGFPVANLRVPLLLQYRLLPVPIPCRLK